MNRKEYTVTLRKGYLTETFVVNTNNRSDIHYIAQRDFPGYKIINICKK